MDPTTHGTAVIAAGLGLVGAPWQWAVGITAAVVLLLAAGLVVRRRFAKRGASSMDTAADAGVVGALRSALGRSRAALQERLDALFVGSVDESILDDIETTLIGADVGVATTARLVEVLRSAMRKGEKDSVKLRSLLRDEMHRVLAVGSPLLQPPENKPWVILVVGVNGSGKTTTIGKLSARFVGEGKRVIIGAADTFRAAAIEQLQVWAQRAGAEVIAHQEGADPAAVAFDTLQAASARGFDVAIIDTAGRLQNRKPLMDQLSKIRRVMDKALPGAPHETLLVVDGTMGQNALSQATLFHEATPLTGVVVTKLDGTAKGGMVVTLAAELQLPVKLIGVGERVEDLRTFEPRAFIEALG